MIRFLCCLGFLLLHLPTFLWGQSAQFNRYTTTDGLPQSQITCLLADQYGFIWAGTNSAGLSRFDGIRFDNFSSQHGLPDERIRTLFQDTTGSIWVGTAMGLALYDGKTFQVIEGSNERTIKAITQDKTGTIWVATEQGLFYVEGKQLAYEPQLGRVPIYALQADLNGVVWIGTDKGLYRYRKGTLSLFGSNKGASGNMVRQIALQKSGKLYIAYQSGQIDAFTDLKFSALSLPFFTQPIIQSLYVDLADKLWLGTAGQGVHFWLSEKQTLTRPAPLADKLFNNTFAIATDIWGQYWIGTNNGLLRYTEQTYSPFDQIADLAGENILSFHSPGQDQTWIGTNKRIVSLKNGLVEAHTEFPTLTPRAIYQDQQERLWIGTERRGLAMYDDRGFYFVGSREELGSTHITGLVQDKQGQFWVATATTGISRLRPLPGDSTGTRFSFQRFSQQEGLGSNQVNQLLFDEQQRLWYAGEEGIGYLNSDSSWLHFSTENGLPDAPVRSLTIDDNGYLWGGTAGGGLFRCRLHSDYITVQIYTTNQGLSSNYINQVHFDEKEQLWLGHLRGVDRLTLDFYDVITELQTFGVAEGFTGIETTANTVWENSQGQLFFGTKNGLMRYTPGIDQRNEIPAPIRIEQVRLFYEPLEKTDFSGWVGPYTGLRKGLVLPHDQNHISFEFDAINQVAPQKVRYQFQLIGADPQWSPVTDQQQATYPNLMPGEYVFNVRSINEDGVTSPEPLHVAFKIEPAIWQRWWFRWGLALLVIGFVSWIIHIRIRQIREKAAAEKAQLEAEKQLLSLEQKALQLQMNPHFIFNALGSIQHLIGQQDHRAARYQLAKFSKLMRSILEHSRSDRISLKDEIELLENYLSLEQFTRNQSFQFEIHMEQDLDPEVIYIPPMMIQPFLENAVIHGVSHVENGLISVYFRRQFNLLICTIEDNGIGRKKASELKSQRGEQHKSLALTVTRERLAALSSVKQVPGLEIKDRQAPEQGTQVVIRLPISSQ